MTLLEAKALRLRKGLRPVKVSAVGPDRGSYCVNALPVSFVRIA